jgi:hypothetical protein
MIWRVIVSEPTRGQSYAEIVERWTIDDLDDANCVLDALEDAQRRQQEQADKRRAAPLAAPRRT